ncbi:MAG: MBL fold metallo-hydrolase [Porticoccaceae bacterium]|jgi:pyrroloquinoline quinone biosynthesis protein B|nr:MBL fold metallo-hydrolase [Porticoccaceae bacterium]MDG1306610.1 MBL fold metallo-hydrolase [Porticoccaceae bacterium]
MLKRVLFTVFLLSASAVTAQPNVAYLYVLGVAQDAGYPQVGCYKPHCMPGWEQPALRRGATSIALIDPGTKTKTLFEATPSMPEQLYALEQEAPSDKYAFNGVFLTHAHMGHYSGLLFFGHEAMGANNVPVYAMPRMRAYLRANGPWSQLVEYNNIALQPLQHNHPVELAGTNVTPLLVPHRDEFSETVGYVISSAHKSALFIPDINKWSVWETNIADIIKTVDYALIDATFYGESELPGRDMSKVPHPFVTESMSILGELSSEQRNKVWFIHMNHTNPLLNANSDEAKYVRSKGFNIAVEGLRLPL